MKQNRAGGPINKAKEESVGIENLENPREGFDNYRSGIEIANQVAGHGSATSERKS